MRAERLAALVLVSLALCLPACGRQPAGAAGGPITLRFWNGFTGPDGKTMEAMVEGFQRENPDIRVKMQIIPWAQYYDKLTLGLAFHEAPDLFVCHANRLPEFAQYGVMRRVEDLQRGPQGLPEADFMPLPWNAAHYQGALYGIPLDCHPLGLYYNKKLFREAGIVDSHGEPEPPVTWEEFLADAHRLTKPLPGGQMQWGFAFLWQHSNWYAFAYQHGGSSLTPDLEHAAINAPPAFDATLQMVSLINRERVAPKPEGIDSWMGFRQGRVGMAMEGIYMLADLQDSAKTTGLDFGGAPIPQFGPIRATWAGSHVLCIPARAKRDRVAAAWRLIRYLSDHSLDWAQGGQVPIRRSLQNTDRFRAMRVQYQFARQIPYVHYEPPTTHGTEIAPFIDAAVESALIGLQSPKAALDEAAVRINHVLARP